MQINIEQFEVEKDFAIDETRLEYEICRLGQLLLQYGDAFGYLKCDLMRQEDQAKRTYAAIAATIRSQAEQEGKKITEGRLVENVTNDPRYQSALDEVHEARAKALRTENWWRAMQKKADLVQALCYRQNREIKHYLEND
jgi:hypothetical protein